LTENTEHEDAVAMLQMQNVNPDNVTVLYVYVLCSQTYVITVNVTYFCNNTSNNG